LFVAYLPSFSFMPVHRDDRQVLEVLRRMAAGAAAVSCLCGAILGALLPVAWRDYRDYRMNIREEAGQVVDQDKSEKEGG